MWVEWQPFGHPGEPREDQHHFSAAGYVDERCSAYAKRRNQHLRAHKLVWGVLKKSSSMMASYENCMMASYEHCFRRRLSFTSVTILHRIANTVWEALCNNKIRNLPHLGKGRSDFNSLDDVLVHAAGANTQASLFAREPTRSLRLVGLGYAAERYAARDSFFMSSGAPFAIKGL